jgi:hypothetical protein
MGRAPRAGDDQLKPAALGLAAVLKQPIGRAMGRDHARLVRDPQLVEQRRGVPHRFPVGLAAHHHADHRRFTEVLAHVPWAFIVDWFPFGTR